MRILILFAAALVAILAPIVARAEAKDPLSYPLKQYGLMLVTALLGGLVSWIAKIRKGEAKPWALSQLVGELTTSAFAGLIAFWLCEWANAPDALTPALVGIAGHMGTRAVTAFEDFATKRWGALVDKP
jgi:hypothetical protein